MGRDDSLPSGHRRAFAREPIGHRTPCRPVRCGIRNPTPVRAAMKRIYLGHHRRGRTSRHRLPECDIDHGGMGACAVLESIASSAESSKEKNCGRRDKKRVVSTSSASGVVMNGRRLQQDTIKKSPARVRANTHTVGILTSSPRINPGDSCASRQQVPASSHHRYLGLAPFVHERALPRLTGRVPPC